MSFGPAITNATTSLNRAARWRSSRSSTGHEDEPLREAPLSEGKWQFNRELADMLLDRLKKDPTLSLMGKTSPESDAQSSTGQRISTPAFSTLSHPRPTTSRSKTSQLFLFFRSKRENALKVEHQNLEIYLKSGLSGIPSSPRKQMEVAKPAVFNKNLKLLVDSSTTERGTGRCSGRG